MKPRYPTVPLTQDEKDFLSDIFKKRLKLFIASFTGMIAVAVFEVIKSDKNYFEIPKLTKSWANIGGIILVIGKTMLLNFLLILFLIILVGTIIFFKRIWPYKKDVKNGVKEVIPYTITGKLYFENTGQYFLDFDDPDYMHYEVDADLYNRYNEGDTINVYRAPSSGYTFDKSGMFSLM